MYKQFFKRFLDITISSVAILLVSPLLLICTVALVLVNKTTPFFLQTRPGLHQRPFKIIKFKSMNDATDAKGVLLPDNQRMTMIGRFIRKASIDELPQLINVLKGDMSLIGPRPLLFKYIPLYTKEQLRRHDVRPGITGLAQVNGRNSISWSQKFYYDIKYVDSVNLRLDLSIIFLTVKKVIVKEGVDQSESRPMEPFNGTN
jgi:undecaprenyl phosphate N,N'-diacetylbacillosamine 1-phosphate transferase